ncbi:MAG: DUF72 domain-containing protein [Acidobacteriota bacterium]|nr:DUF72 domain-containing protein [Acidobacteriota bacterium]
MNGKIRIGTCGFHVTKEKYAELFSTVEIQHTFYQPPQIKTLERWRAEVPENFEFAIKAWQLITHEAKSPTYKRLKKKLTEEQLTQTGRFQPTAIVREAWETTLACAKALQAKTILFQCPASFKPYEENLENLEKFFSQVKHGKLNFAFEPRGVAWTDKIIKDICDRFDLWHTVDPFARITTTPDKIYYRLHGRTGWRYKYEPDELEELAAMLPKNKISYVFFNNIQMTEDALVFQEMVK